MDRKQRANAASISETDRQYLESSGITTQICDALSKFVENQPDNAVNFLASYYEEHMEKSDRLGRALYYITLSHFSKQCFDSNLKHAYEYLTTGNASGHIKVLKGIVYMDLLKALCKDIPEKSRDLLLHKLHCRDHEIVLFNTFKSSILICLIMKEYTETVKTLYSLLVAQSSSQLEARKEEGSSSVHERDRLRDLAGSLFCNSLCSRLTEVVNTSKESALLWHLKANQSLSPYKLVQDLSNTATMKPGYTSHLDQEDFMNKMSLIFIDKIENVR